MGYGMEDSDIVGLKAVAASIGTSSLQFIESKGLTIQPKAVSTDTTEQFNIGMEKCGWLVVLVRLTAHKE